MGAVTRVWAEVSFYRVVLHEQSLPSVHGGHNEPEFSIGLREDLCSRPPITQLSPSDVRSHQVCLARCRGVQTHGPYKYIVCLETSRLALVVVGG